MSGAAPRDADALAAQGDGAPCDRPGCRPARCGNQKTGERRPFAPNLSPARVTNQIKTDLQVGLEIFHQTADTIGGQDTTSVGIGVRYDLNDHLHLLGYVGRGIENVDVTDRLNWYTSILFTF